MHDDLWHLIGAERMSETQMIPLLSGKRILLGVTGSIAAYKAAEVASRLTQTGAEVEVAERAATAMYVPYDDERGIHPQDESGPTL